MAKTQKNESVAEQMDLIDVGPKNLKEISSHAKRYQAAMKRRANALTEETHEKQAILDLVKKANLSRLQDGTIKFTCDGMLITITPRDELVRIKEKPARRANLIQILNENTL